MNDNQFEKYNYIPEEKFAFASDVDLLHDNKLETKPVGYLRDAFRRFTKNKGSVVAGIIIIILVLFAIIGPYCCSSTYQNAYATDTKILTYKELLPSLRMFKGTGFWDGSKTEKGVNERTYAMLVARGLETGKEPIAKVVKEYTDDLTRNTYYDLKVDSYYNMDWQLLTVTYDDYVKMQQWQDEHNRQLIYPRVNAKKAPLYNNLKSVWYVSDIKGTPKYDANGDYIPAYYTPVDIKIDDANAPYDADAYVSKMRIAGDPGIEDPESLNRYHYAQRTGSEGAYNYVLRVDPYEYFEYCYGFEPCFIFGTDSSGYDIFSRLARGARFSLLLALLVSAVNLTIGAIYGAIEGYYGGVVDMTMERISDILSNVPFMVVTILFKLHLASKVGIVGSLIFAFILTGWIGMASSVRMQFYRFKNQEYVLAARTLGASDKRIMFKHIFPNSLGTLITGSVLVIPGVIFSETSLSYLGIINLDSATRSSVGSMLSAGQSAMTHHPHIVLFPALFIGLLMISFNLFGNGLRDAFNPSLRGAE